MSPTLASIVAQHPYPDFQKWWPLGEPFLAMMADAILGQWRPLAPSSDDLAAVQTTVDKYISLVYKREARPRLAANFAAATDLNIPCSPASSMRYPMDSSDPPTGRWPRCTAATNWSEPAVSSLNGWGPISSPNCQTAWHWIFPALC